MKIARSPATASLNRQIGPIAMLLTAITSIIGSGWLFASMYAAQIAGPAAVISWLIGGGVVISLALVYAELGGMLPVAGALARIPCFSHGPLSGFMAGWLCWIAYVATAPIEVTAVLDYASNYLPWLTISEHGERVLTPIGLMVAMILMLVFTLINMLGVKWLAHANSAITVWKLAVPLLAALVLISAGFQADNFHAFGGFAPNGISGIFAAVSGGGILFSLFGFRVVIDMAGEAERPQRSVPLAVIGAVIICLGIYILLQVAFIGVIPVDHLAHGWQNIEENVPGGPFAAFAAILGLQWLALTLYADAIISPAGTGLTFIGATARINYAMSQNGQFPKSFARLNRFRVPVWSLLFNFVVGMVLFLPFPGWSELVGFISSAAILSFAFGPVSLAALRHQAADLERPYRVPFGRAFAALTFVFVGFVVYWTGWETNWKVFLMALAGLLFLAVSRASRKHDGESLQLKHSAWFWPYLSGLGVISWLGNYGNGLGVLAHGVDLVLIVILSLVIFRWAVKLRLPDAETRRLLNGAE
jgi:amino acid transporter